MYVALGGFTDSNLWRTTDGGLTFTDATGDGPSGLPWVPIRTIARAPGDPGRIFVGTEIGVFSTRDGGATWAAATQGPANVAVDELSSAEVRFVEVAEPSDGGRS